MENGKLIALNTLAQYVGKAISVVASVLVTMFLARNLGVTNYGNYVLVLNIIMFGNAIAEWGMTFIATREAAKSRNEVSWFDTVFISRICTSMILAMIIVAFWPKWAGEISINVGLIAISLVLLLAVKSWLQVIFQTQMSLWKLTIVDTSGTILFGACVALLAFFGSTNLVNIIASLVFSTVLSVVIGFGFVLTTKYRPSLVVDRKMTMRLFRESLVMGAVLVIFSIYNKVDVFILKAIKGDFEVGIYGLAYKIYENVIIGAAFFANSIFPILAKKSKYKAEFRRVLSKSLMLFFGGGLAAAITTWILAPVAIEVLGGKDYGGAVLALRWLCVAVVFAYVNHGLGYATIALGKQRVSAMIAFFGLLVNLVTNYALIPKYGYLAAASMTGVTEGAVLVLTAFYLWRKVFSRS